MEIKNTVQKPVEVIEDIICDCCGKSCKDENGSFECMKLQSHWGYTSKKDLQTWVAHLCESCVDEKLGFIKFNVSKMKFTTRLAGE